jgi:excisionase family DNA binding protein
MQFLTTEQAAARLGVSPRRVQIMAQSGRLPASRFGRALMIKEEDLALVSDRKTGRPKKADGVLAPEETPITRAEMKAGDVVRTPPASAPARTNKTSGKIQTNPVKNRAAKKGK